MIKTFKVKNFKNFEKELVLDFSKVRDYSFNSTLIKNNLINKMLVCGKNNCGKSNLGAAIMDITRHLTDKNTNNRLYYYYKNGNSIEDLVEFEYEFIFNKTSIIYSYKKDANANLVYEELKEGKEVLFKYNYKTNKYINNIEDAKTIDLKKNRDMSALKYIYNNTLYWSTNSPVKLLMEFVNNMLWFRSLKSNEFMGVVSDSENLNDFIINNNCLPVFEKFLKDCGQEFDLCIINDGGKNRVGVKFDNYEAKFESVASTGTLSLWLFFYWMNKSDKISFIFLDEFDAFYHYELALNILKYVIDKKDCQSILTSHNTYLIDNEIMRPDCYVMLKDGEMKSFADCTSKNIRQAHNLSKMMFGGEFEK